MKRRGLGRGLGALLATDATDGVTAVPVDRIRANPYQPRREIAPADLAELVESIGKHGVLQPILVARDDEGFVLIAGERRWRAAIETGLLTVPAVVRAVSPKEMLALAIVENVQRSDLDAMESAQAYRRLMDEFGLAQGDVAGLVGKTRSAVANTMRLLGLEPEIQALIRSGQLHEGHGRALLAVAAGTLRRQLAERAAAEGWTVRRMEAESRAPDAGGVARTGTRKSQSVGDPNVDHAVRELESSLRTKVEIKRRGDQGRLIVHFYSDEELDGLYRRLLGGG